MRALAWIAWLALAPAAWAQGPDDYRSRAKVTIAEEDALQRLILPPEVYRDAKADLADVRVFNGNGEGVPIALGTEPERAREAQASQVLPHFPVASLDIAPEHVGVRIRLSDGTLIETRGNRAPGRTQALKAYLLDASAVKLPVRALVLDWDPSSGSEIVRVHLEGSSDLRSWHALPVAPVSIVHLEQAGRTLEQPRIPLGRSQEKYLRLTWDGPATLRLRSVRAEFDDRLKPPDRMTSRVTGQKGEKPGEIVYDLGARYPVEALRLLPADRNAVIPVRFEVEGPKEGARMQVASGVFYSLQRNGATVESPPLEIGRRSARRWIARIDPDSGAVGQALPELEVQWRPAQLIFVARGEPPFMLAFGDAQAKPAYNSPSTLIPGYEAHMEDALPQAKLGAVERTPGANRHYPEWMAGVPPRRFALWTILIAAVAALGFMAWRLSTQMKRADDEDLAGEGEPDTETGTGTRTKE